MPGDELLTLRMVLEIPAGADAAAIARKVVRAGLEAAGRVQDVYEMDLIVRELVSNAVSHTDSDVVLTLTVEDGGRVLLEVSDQSEETWAEVSEIETVDDLSAAGGIGLRIVDALAARWGCVLSDGPGKTVWIEQVPGSS